MTSQRPIDAHRPLPQGKAAVRYNGLRHGITTRHAALEGEGPADFERRQALPAGLFAPPPTFAEIYIDLKNQTQPPDKGP